MRVQNTPYEGKTIRNTSKLVVYFDDPDVPHTNKMNVFRNVYIRTNHNADLLGHIS